MRAGLKAPDRGAYVYWAWGAERGMLLVASTRETYEDYDNESGFQVSGWLVRDGQDGVRWVEGIEHCNSTDVDEPRWSGKEIL